MNMSFQVRYLTINLVKWTTRMRLQARNNTRLAYASGNYKCVNVTNESPVDLNAARTAALAQHCFNELSTRDEFTHCSSLCTPARHSDTGLATPHNEVGVSSGWSNVLTRENHSVTVIVGRHPPSCTGLPTSTGTRIVDDAIHSCVTKQPEKSTKDSEAPNASGRPTAEQLANVEQKLAKSLPQFFYAPLDFSIYHSDIIFENNMRGITTRGIMAYVRHISMIKVLAHLRYAHVRMEVLKITCEEDDGTVRVRWRVKGIGGIRIMLTFWKLKLWNLKQGIEDNSELTDGFSVFYVRGDGKVHRHTADKMMPDDSKTLAKKPSWLARLLGSKQKALATD